MINLEKINSEIIEMEKHDTTYATCERLAWLYIVRDHLNGYAKQSMLTVDVTGESDFMRAVSGKSADEVWGIMDELMNTLKVVSPNLYNGVMRKIQ